MAVWTDRATVTVEVELNGVWTDISGRVLRSGGPIDIGTGRQTELSAGSPATMSLVLDNDDGALIPGNTSSPYYPYWRNAARIRCAETIGYRTFRHLTGWLEVPEVTVYGESTDGAYVKRTTTVNVVDRIARLERGRSFVSTLSEYILYQGGSSLKAYYPLLEPDGVRAYDKSAYAREAMEVGYRADPAEWATVGGPQFEAGGGDTVPADDLPGPAFDPYRNPTWRAYSAYLRATWVGGILQSSGETVTVAAWVKLDSLMGSEGSAPFSLWGDTISDAYLELAGNSASWNLGLDAGAATTFPAVSTGPSTGMWQLVALRLTLPSGLVEYWRHGDAPVTTTVGAGASLTWRNLDVGRDCVGTVTHAQVYVGVGAYTRAMHLAQIRAGYEGLAGQTTGERIATIAGYAGIAAGDLVIDPGTVRMPSTSLAGKAPLEPMREAETTEQGLLIADGAGRLTFADRARRYNI